jgi:hypothetical protein
VVIPTATRWPIRPASILPACATTRFWRSIPVSIHGGEPRPVRRRRPRTAARSADRQLPDRPGIRRGEARGGDPAHRHVGDAADHRHPAVELRRREDLRRGVEPRERPAASRHWSRRRAPGQQVPRMGGSPWRDPQPPSRHTRDRDDPPPTSSAGSLGANTSSSSAAIAAMPASFG